MQSALLVQKGITTQNYDAKTRRIPVTILNASQILLADVKTLESDGYTALKLTSGSTKHIDKPTAGILKKKGITTIPKLVKEIRIKETVEDRVNIVKENGKLALKIGESTIAIGSSILPTQMFKIGDLVDVSGTSKGKGFQGVVKRHNFSGGPKTHGQSDRWRSPGSIGSTTTPGRIFKGKRMAGRMGGETITVQKLEVVNIDEKTISVKGLVPGVVGANLVIRLSQPVK